jgi:hypothetical protein
MRHAVSDLLRAKQTQAAHGNRGTGGTVRVEIPYHQQALLRFHGIHQQAGGRFQAAQGVRAQHARQAHFGVLRPGQPARGVDPLQHRVGSVRPGNELHLGTTTQQRRVRHERARPRPREDDARSAIDSHVGNASTCHRKNRVAGTRPRHAPAHGWQVRSSPCRAPRWLARAAGRTAHRSQARCFGTERQLVVPRTGALRQHGEQQVIAAYRDVVATLRDRARFPRPRTTAN